MLSGHAGTFHHRSDSGELLEEILSESDDEESEHSGKILYRASFQELERNYLQYDTIIWVLISLLLVMAWGVGLLMLIYLPFKRYVLQKEISSRTLSVTENNIVYKASRPSFVPFLKPVKIKKIVPLLLVIDIIIEQGFLQSVYGIYTLRIESIAHGKAAPVDELLFQGVSNPQVLRKVIVAEAARRIKEVNNLKSVISSSFREGAFSNPRMRSVSDIKSFNRILHSPSGKVTTLRRGPSDAGAAIPADLFFQKLEEINQSVKKIESLVGGSPSLEFHEDS